MYSYKKKLSTNFEESIKRLNEELPKEGFGILIEIDIKSKLKEKLGVELEDYRIFGVCNPPFANRAIEVEKEIGLMLPCNIILYKDNNEIYISSILPTVTMKMINNDKLSAISKEIEDRLKRVIDNT